MSLQSSFLDKMANYRSDEFGEKSPLALFNQWI